MCKNLPGAHGKDFFILHDQSAVYDHCIHLAAVQRVHKPGNKIVPREKLRCIHVHGDNVGQGTLFQNAQPAFHAQGLCTALRGHLKDLNGTHALCAPGVSLVHQSRSIHFLEHVLGVVAAAAVGAQAYIDARLQKFVRRSKTVPQLHVALGVDRDGDIFFLHDADIIISCVYAVGGDGRYIKEAKVGHIFYRGDPVLPGHVFHFGAAFRKVYGKADAFGQGIFPDFFKIGCRAAVGRMGSEKEIYPVVIFKCRHFRKDLPEFFKIYRIVRVPREAAAQPCPDAGVIYRAGNGPGGAFRGTGLCRFDAHVHKCSGAGADHLDRGKTRTPVAVLLRQVVFNLLYAVQPVKKCHVIGSISEKGHICVSVRIDETRHYDFSESIHHLICCICKSGVCLRHDGSYCVAINQDIIFFDFEAVAVRKQAEAVFN